MNLLECLSALFGICHCRNSSGPPSMTSLTLFLENDNTTTQLPTEMANSLKHH